MTDQEDHGKRACLFLAHRCFVALVCTKPLDTDEVGPIWVGSGTLVRAGDRTAVLTARHNVEHRSEVENLHLFGAVLETVETPSDAPRLHLPVGPRGEFRLVPVSRTGHSWTLRNFAGAVHHAPDDLDVALVEVRPEYDGVLVMLDLALPSLADVISPDEDVEVRDDDLLYAIGAPAQLAQFQAGNNHVRLATFAYSTSSRPGCASPPEHPARGLHLDWRAAVEARSGRSVPMVHPRGMSGAAVWRFRGRRGGTWDAGSRARIVAIASSMFPKGAPECERCESVADFGPWLLGVAESIANRAASPAKEGT